MRGRWMLVLAVITLPAAAYADDGKATKWTSPDDGANAATVGSRETHEDSDEHDGPDTRKGSDAHAGTSDAPPTPAPRDEIGAADLRSTGRSVRIELLDVEPRVSCETPCLLRAPAGVHRARIDGLQRRIVVGGDGSPSRVLIRPTRRLRQALGFASLVVGATGLTVAGSWAVRLDNSTRLKAALGGALFLGLAVPLLTSSSVRVELGMVGERAARRPQPSAVEVLASVHQLAFGRGEPAASTFVAGGLGYRPRDSSLAYAARGRIAGDDGASYQVVAGAQLFAPRLPIVQPTLFVGAGAASRRPPLAMGERLAASTELVFEVEAQLIVEVPWDLKPRVALVGDAFASTGDVVLAWEAGLLARF